MTSEDILRDSPTRMDWWPYEAVVHGVDVEAICLAITDAGDRCTYHAYSNEALCGTHQTVDDPDVLEGAHQWARIVDKTSVGADVDVVVVCPNCEEVWLEGPPSIGLDCPTCPADAGERCFDTGSVTNRSLPPHPERRDRALDLIPMYEPCPEAPVGRAGPKAEAIADGTGDRRDGGEP